MMEQNNNEISMISQGEGRFLIKGVMSFATVMDLWKQGEQLMADAPNLKLDLKEVSRTDSAGIALLVEWLRNANQQNRKIQFLNIPTQMLAIARISGLDDILPLSRE